MPGLPWLIAQSAFKMTVKGAAVTLTSTVASCTLACYIEIGAHRVVYHYFPYKYANVKYANGLTQEQLDAVRIHTVDHTVRWSDEEQVMEERVTMLPQNKIDEAAKHVPSEDTTAFSTISTLPRDSPYSFWKEEKREETSERSSPLLELGQLVFSSNDILACSMTC
jgi:hypothetical protein